MKKLFCFLIFIFTIHHLSAQTENYTTAIDHFQKNYNTGKYEEIFNSFSTGMKQALPLENTKQFLAGLKAQAGDIKSKEFTGYQQGTYATYKTQFEKTVLAVNISLDKQNTINGLFIKPYEEIKESQSKTVNALTIYPKEIAEIIYSKSKDFPDNTQLSIALIQNGKTNYYGILKENGAIKPIENQNKIFEIGSITKVFTSTVLASLAEANKIKLTDNINPYYPFAFKNNITLNFESLANHTSGLPRLPDNLDLSNEANPYKAYHLKELEEYLKNFLIHGNKTYSYSNLGAGLLGYTLGLSQKTTFQKLVQKNIFDKYHMNSSFTSSEGLGGRLIKGYRKNGEIASNWDFDVLFGAGGILSTTEDLAKFANAQFDPENKELALTRKPTFTINGTMKIGLGWHILISKEGKEFVWHNGGTGGYSSSMAVNANDKTAVIILSNVSEINDPIDKICFELLNSTNQK
ncbi:penicillin-binding protein [Chryseobacterium gallinarum]|uniref:Penicillin-binding protein n=1 Tax=Chryseobacterium gallinarum TaxID=1324352 RepID=A0A0G3M225_CHRGL|nr:serine hydrolase [Chryseobacterium gallinarum]AKK72028.1 penicillin-binding protein [Chryseobacterium gallinarum]